MNKQQLASRIWASANKMRSKIEANEYKDYILGFIFYKYLSETEVKFLKANEFCEEDIKGLKEEDKDTREYIQKGIGYFISYENLFSTWLAKGKDFDVSNVSDALSAFSRLIAKTHEKVFTKILDTLQAGLSKLGDTSGARTKAISDLIQLINVIPMDDKQDYDVLGFIYEYLIGNFAANAGKKAGEFYTPHEVSLLMSEIVADHLKDRQEIEIYDPTSGSGSLLINIGRSVAKHMPDKNKIKYYAQELKENTYNLTRMNLVMRGIIPNNIVVRNGDTLEHDWPYFEKDDINTYTPLYVDAVVSNPPYSQHWDPKDKENNPRFAGFGLAPKSKADYAFLLHDLYHLKPDGIMAIVLPHGVLFRGGEEGEIRKNLIERNHIDAIIGLPANIFFGTGIPTIIMVLKKRRKTTDVLIIDASKGYSKVGKNNVLRASDIKKIADTVAKREEIEKFSRVVRQEEIRQNEYNLNIPRYVDSSEPAETWDIYASMFGGIPKHEIALLDEYWKTFKGLKETLFTETGTPYCEIAVDNVEKAIKEYDSVVAYHRNYQEAFAGLGKYLKDELIGKCETLNVNKEESIIADEIFKRLEKTALVDKYTAYQTLDEQWQKATIDLEIIQTEGFEATKKVDPNMITKKKGDKEEEIQDGYVGHVIPFELIQETILKEQTKALKKKEERLQEIASTYEEILDSLTEEDKENEVVNETKDAFVNAEILKWVKTEYGTLGKAKEAVKGFDEESLEKKLVQVNELIDEEKSLKRQTKKEYEELHMLTKKAIEDLTDEKVIDLLELKWITPLMEAIKKLPEDIVSELVTKVKALAEKYKTTYAEVADQIKDTKASLNTLIDGLTGNDYDMKGLKEFQALLKGE
jgi:type I restriction enzyme M protein